MILAIPAEIVLLIAALLVLGLAIVGFIFYAGTKQVNKLQAGPNPKDDEEIQRRAE